MAWDEALPRWSDEEFSSFLESVGTYGVLDPIWQDQHGNVIDGRKRRQAAQQHGIKNVPTNTVRMENDDQRLELWLTLNCQRRHLTTENKQALADLVLKRWPRRSDRALALLIGIDHKTVAKRRADLVASGEIPHFDKHVGHDGKERRLKKIYTFTAQAEKRAKYLLKQRGSQLPEREVTLFSAQKVSRNIDEEAKYRKLLPLPAAFQLHHGDFRDMKWPKLDLVFTDLPYEEKHLPLWDALGKLAADRLKAGGLLVAYTGIAHLPRVTAALSKHLTYFWACTIYYVNRKITAIRHRGFWCQWRPILIYSNGKGKINEAMLNAVTDAYYSKTSEKILHPNQQTIDGAMHYMRHFSKPGHVIGDFCMGSGTFGVAVAKLGEGRKYIGTDINPACVAIANNRIAETLGVAEQAC